MRKSALSTRSNKVYNPNSLEVTGEKITLLKSDKLKKSQSLNKKTLKIESKEQEELYTIQKPCPIHSNPTQSSPVKCTYKNFLKTSVTEYTNKEVSNKVLNQIRETSKVEDFERILQSLCQSDNFLTGKSYIRRNKTDKVLENLEAEDLYQEFFGKHFDYLSSVVNRARGEDCC